MSAPLLSALAGVLASVVVATQAPTIDPAPNQPDQQLESMPEDWFGPGPLHKVLIEAPAQGVLQTLTARGALAAQVDYGAFVLAIVDGEAFGGQAAFEAAGLTVRDEQDLVALNGYFLNGKRPAETLERLDPAERLGSAVASLPLLEAGLYIVQFRGPVRDDWLALAGIDRARFAQAMPMNAYVVQLTSAEVLRLDTLRAARPEIQYFGVYQPAFRMTGSIRAAAQLQGPARPVTVQLVDGAGVRATLERIREESTTPIEHYRIGPYVNVGATLAPATFRSFAADPSVFAIEDRGTPQRTDERQGQIGAGNVSGTGPSAPTYLAWLASEGFNSSQFGSFAINVVDDSTSLAGHPDLPSGRVAFTQNPTGQTGSQSGHGFLNAHIVAGFNSSTSAAVNDSAGYNYGLGIAPWARVGSTAIFGPGGLNPSAFESSAYVSGSRISTNSWTFVTGGSNPIPDYDSSAQLYDFLVRDARSAQSGNQDYMILFSASNDGPAANTVSTPATAKNVLTVGASENNRQTGTDGCGVPNSGANNINDIISFSSMGPVNSSGGDGRWKPEIVAPGTHIQAGVPQSNYNGSGVCNAFWPGGQTLYGWSSGTSHSTPAVAGSAALVHQWFLNQGMSAPSAAMKKAVIVNSAAYLTGAFANDTLPSNSQGMGRVDLGNVFGATGKIVVDQSVLLSSSGASHVETGSVDSTSSPFRVTLVWTDAPGPTTGAPYVNNLDLTVTVGGLTYRGNRFSGSTSITGGAADFRNNTESVFLPSGTSGSFTVNVVATSIGGDGVPGNGDTTDQDFALFIENGTTGAPGAPAAEFSGVPTSGNAPLAVAFTDLSSGTVTTRSWNFGDGVTSTAQNPSHTYTLQGNYTVSLTVTGPGGSDTETKTNYISVGAPPGPGVSDGSFESQIPSTVPLTPWSIFGGDHIVSPSGVPTDSGMPTHGSNWCEIGADSTNGATPPSNPGGVTVPPVGGAGVTQSFTYAAGQTQLSFEASFLRNEDANQTQFNDWMSVDITDGSTTRNVFYKDTFSPTSGTSAKYGYAITPVETVAVDLASLFPSSTTSTNFTLTAQVGNGFDDFQPSKGYIDDFQLEGGVQAPTAEFNGFPTSGTAPLAVSFGDASTGSITSWSWSFGDGGTSTSQNP
ncbi:MAG: S8 family serine peptidase, partial [bacterium]|nr:S8 family serine peptidase [bacterium]